MYVHQRVAEVLNKMKSTSQYYHIRAQLIPLLVSIIHTTFYKQTHTDINNNNNNNSKVKAVLLSNDLYMSVLKKSQTRMHRESERESVCVYSVSHFMDLACNAELNNNYKRAVMYYKQCICLCMGNNNNNNNDSKHNNNDNYNHDNNNKLCLLWYLYGTCCLRFGDMDAADECFQQSLSIKQHFHRYACTHTYRHTHTHIHIHTYLYSLSCVHCMCFFIIFIIIIIIISSILAHAASLCEQDDVFEAEQYINNAIKVNPASPLALAMKVTIIKLLRCYYCLFVIIIIIFFFFIDNYR